MPTTSAPWRLLRRALTVLDDNRISAQVPMSDGSPDIDTWQRDVILRNAVEDPYYAPYCTRCPGLIRMLRVEQHYWKCRCGAQCDYRLAVEEPTP
jgi:hypothetical protein